MDDEDSNLNDQSHLHLLFLSFLVISIVHLRLKNVDILKIDYTNLHKVVHVIMFARETPPSI